MAGRRNRRSRGALLEWRSAAAGSAHAADVARACVEASGRSVSGLIGPPDQVETARRRWAWRQMRPPATSRNGCMGSTCRSSSFRRFFRAVVTGRAARPEERGLLHAWGLAYDMERMGAIDTPEARRRSAEFMDLRIGTQRPGGRRSRRHAGVIFSVQCDAAQHRPAGRGLHAARAAKSRLRQGIGRPLAARRARPRADACDSVYQWDKRRSNLCGARLPADRRLCACSSQGVLPSVKCAVRPTAASPEPPRPAGRLFRWWPARCLRADRTRVR